MSVTVSAMPSACARVKPRFSRPWTNANLSMRTVVVAISLVRNIVAQDCFSAMLLISAPAIEARRAEADRLRTREHGDAEAVAARRSEIALLLARSGTRMCSSLTLDERHMGQKGRDRGPRRREFDDDRFGGGDTRDESPRQSFQRTPREDAAPTGPAVDATVIWFNAEKGFGFVQLGDGSGDAFLHVGVLEKAGHDIVTPETKLRVQVGQGQKGRQVTAVLEVAASGAGPTQPSRRSSPKMLI